MGADMLSEVIKLPVFIEETFWKEKIDGETTTRGFFPLAWKLAIQGFSLAITYTGRDLTTVELLLWFQTKVANILYFLYIKYIFE